MPSVVEQRIDNSGIYIRFSNGQVYQKSNLELAAQIVTSGNRTKAINDLKTAIRTAGGLQSTDLVTFDFDATGRPVNLAIGE